MARRFGGGWMALTTVFGAALVVVAGCDALAERHCRSGEIVISNTEGGSNCQAGRPGDRACLGDQVLERQPELRRERCIPDRIDRAPSSTEWLPSTGD